MVGDSSRVESIECVFLLEICLFNLHPLIFVKNGWSLDGGSSWIGAARPAVVQAGHAKFAIIFPQRIAINCDLPQNYPHKNCCFYWLNAPETGSANNACIPMLCFFHSHVSQCVPLQLLLWVNSQRDNHGLDNLTKDEENQQRTESLTARHDPGQEYSKYS